MKLTKERKIYAGLFVLAACAFAGDQLFSGPKEAAASVDAAVVATAQAAPAAAGATKPNPHSANTTQLAQRLRALDHEEALSASALSDPFKLSKTWDGAALAQGDGSISSFIQRHRLTAVMVSGVRGSAIIDGELVRVGQSLEGFKLVEVSTKSAMFERNKQIARLTLTDN
jgi:hypothetical protein